MESSKRMTAARRRASSLKRKMRPKLRMKEIVSYERGNSRSTLWI